MANEAELQQAVELIKAGRKKSGGRILEKILQADPNNERAWLWVSACVDNDDERRYCMEQVLRINPNNKAALKALEQLHLPERKMFSDDTPASSQTQQPAEGGSEDFFSARASLFEDSASPEIDPSDAIYWTGSPTRAETTSLPGDVPAPSQPGESGAAAQAPAQPVPVAPAPAAPRRMSTITIVLIVLLVLVLACTVCAGVGYIYFNSRVQQLQQSTGQDFQVEYIVGGTSTNIGMTFTTETGEAQAWNVRRPPFTKAITMKGMTPIFLVAENQNAQGTVSCEIKVNGRSVSKADSSDPQGQASCAGMTGLNP